jgi:hypothetical protein
MPRRICNDNDIIHLIRQSYSEYPRRVVLSRWIKAVLEGQ